MAPEIIESKGHGQAVDWWSLGAILFEMLTGMPPFYAKDREKLFNTIKSGSVKYPKYLSKDAVNLLDSFFIKDPEKRLGSGANGFQNLKSHPFFASIDWDAILKMNIKPPFVPKIKNEFDTRYIDPEFTNLTLAESFNQNENVENSENPYQDFSYDPKKNKQMENINNNNNNMDF